MWIVLARQAHPPAHVWRGRIPLAVVDACGWALAFVDAVCRSPIDTGVFGRASVAVALLLAVRGMWTGLFHNDRYRFVTWRLWSMTWPLFLIAVAMEAAFWLLR